MILTIGQMQALIKQPKNEDLIVRAVGMSAKLRMHVNGANAVEYVEQLSGVESDEEKDLRKELTRSNRSAFSTMLRPFDKVFSANGGSVFYDCPDENGFTNKLDNIANGIGLRKWMRKRWKNKFFVDPNGVLLIETSEEIINPTYKAITTIHDYQPKGIYLEYIIFKPLKGKQLKHEGLVLEDDYYRVIDDKADYLIHYKNEKATIIKDYSFDNLIGRVPGVLCSDMLDVESNAKASPVEDVIDIADEYLRDTSVHTTYKILHSYPIFWAYLPDCKKCNGTGLVDGVKCSTCKGYGKDLRKDVSKIIGLEPPADGEVSLTPPAGYVQTDVASWSQQRLELDWLQRLMHWTLWGTHTREQAANETATGRFLDSQPALDRMDEFSETAETIEQALTDFIGQYTYKNSYKGSSVGYGRRYLIESPDAIWKRYEAARKSGAPKGTLDYLLMQFYETEFKTQPMKLQVFTKLMAVEPFLHLTEKEVSDLEIIQEDKLRKFYYNEWLGTLTDGDIIRAEVTKLREALTLFIKNKSINKTEL